MPTVKVTKIGKTQAGRDKVYFDGREGPKDAFLVGNDTTVPPLGAMIEADTASQNYRNNVYWWLNAWKLSQDAQAHKTASNGRDAFLRPSSTATNGTGWSVDAKDCMIFLEVVVKAAFDKDRLTDADDLFTWTAATYRAVEQLRSGKIRDFNDKMPPVSVTEAFPDDGLNGPIDDGAPDF